MVGRGETVEYIGVKQAVEQRGTQTALFSAIDAMKAVGHRDVFITAKIYIRRCQ